MGCRGYVSLVVKDMLCCVRGKVFRLKTEVWQKSTECLTEYQGLKGPLSLTEKVLYKTVKTSFSFWLKTLARRTGERAKILSYISSIYSLISQIQWFFEKGRFQNFVQICINYKFVICKIITWTGFTIHPEIEFWLTIRLPLKKVE